MYKTNDACIIEIGMNYLVTAFDFLSNVQSSFPTMSTFTRGRPPSNWATGNRVPGCLVLSCRGDQLLVDLSGHPPVELDPPV